MSTVGLSITDPAGHASTARGFFLAVIVLTALCFVPAPVSAAPILSVSPTSSDLLIGDPFTLDVSVENVTDLYAFQFNITFDPTVLRVDDVLEGAFLSSGGPTLFVPDINQMLGSLTFTASLIGPVSGVSGHGVLATLAFTTIAPGTGSVTLADVILLDSSLTDIPDVSLQSGDVTVRERTPVPEPSSLGLMSLGTALIAVWRLRRHVS
jgi:general secretion pathway protein D